MSYQGSHQNAVRSPIMLTGQFLGFIFSKKQHLRALRLRWFEQEVVIRVAKYLRNDRAVMGLLPGMQVQVWGTQKLDVAQSKLKLKAHKLVSLAAGDRSQPSPAAIAAAPTPDSLDPAQIQSPQIQSLQVQLPQIQSSQQPQPITAQGLSACSAAKPLKVKVCTKSDCMKRGGKAICKLLSQAEQQQGCGFQIQETGCMGKCKTGPHLVVMPDRVSYSKIKPQEVSSILAKHLQIPEALP